MSSNRSRNWCYTVYEHEWDKFEKMCTLEYAEGKLVYYIYGKEVCPDTGRLHWQGYMEFKNPRTLSGLRKKFGPVHMETRKGTATEAIEYCKKHGDYISHGIEPTGQGARTDLVSVKQLVDEGKNMYEIVDVIGDNYQAVKHAEVLMKYRRKKGKRQPIVKWFYGPTGCGKSYTACSEAEAAGVDYWMSTGDLRFWNGYECEKFVILDDFRPSHCDFATLLRWLDVYEVRVNTKHGYRALCAETIVITSSKHPRELYAYKTDENLSQLCRRISEIREFMHPYCASGTDTQVGGNTEPRLVPLSREVVPDRIYEIQEPEEYPVHDPENSIYEIPVLNPLGC